MNNDRFFGRDVDTAPSTGRSTCDPCLGIGYAAPKHWRCHGGACACCGSAPVVVRTRVSKPHPVTPKPYVYKPRRRTGPYVRPPLTPVELAELTRLRGEGLSWRQIAAELGRDHSGLAKAWKRQAAPHDISGPTVLSG